MRLNANTRVSERFELRKRLWKKPCLHEFCNCQFLGYAPFGLNLLWGGTPLCFDLANEVVPPHKRKGISIQIVKASENSAPKRRLRWMVKTNATLPPLLELGHNIFGDKHSISGAADQLVFFGFMFGSHQSENRAAVWRRDPDPTATGFIPFTNTRAISKRCAGRPKAATFL